jgi:dUTPase
MVLLFNLGTEDFSGMSAVAVMRDMEADRSVNKGDRIAQLVLEKICLADIVETDVRWFPLVARSYRVNN